MINCTTGLIGGGKSYLTVKRSLAYVANGGQVYSNIKLNVPNALKYIRKRLKVKLTCLDLLSRYHYLPEMSHQIYQEIPQGAGSMPNLLVIDEAADWFDANFNKQDLHGFCSFCRQSRKLNIDIWFIVQDLSMLTKRVRVLCAWIYRAVDFQKFRAPGIPFSFAWLNMFLFQQFDRTGKFLIKNHWFGKDTMVFDSYYTQQVYRKFSCESKTESKKAAGGSISFIMWLCVVSLGWGLWGAYRKIDRMGAVGGSGAVHEIADGVYMQERSPVMVRDNRKYWGGHISGSMVRDKRVVAIYEGKTYTVGANTAWGVCVYVDNNVIICKRDGEFNVLGGVGADNSLPAVR